MIAHALLRTGMEPAYLIGGALRTTGLNAEWGAGEWLVVEADESDRSMLELHVEIAVVTNVELDHHATYGSLAEVREVFRAFLAGVPEAVLWDRPDVVSLRAADAPRVLFDVPDPVLDPGGSRFTWRGHEVAADGARAPTTPATPPRRWRRARLAGADVTARGLGGAGRLRRSGPPVRARSARRRPAPSSSTTTPTTRPRSPRRSTPPGRSAPRRVVAVFQPHLYSRTRAAGAASSARRSRAPTSSPSSTSTRRASAPRTSRGSRA